MSKLVTTLLAKEEQQEQQAANNKNNKDLPLQDENNISICTNSTSSSISISKSSISKENSSSKRMIGWPGKTKKSNLNAVRIKWDECYNCFSKEGEGDFLTIGTSGTSDKPSNRNTTKTVRFTLREESLNISTKD